MEFVESPFFFGIAIGIAILILSYITTRKTVRPHNTNLQKILQTISNQLRAEKTNLAEWTELTQRKSFLFRYNFLDNSCMRTMLSKLAVCRLNGDYNAHAGLVQFEDMLRKFQCDFFIENTSEDSDYYKERVCKLSNAVDILLSDPVTRSRSNSLYCKSCTERMNIKGRNVLRTTV